MMQAMAIRNASGLKPVVSQKGADLCAQTLRAIGVTDVFCYPGGANLELLDALSRVDIACLT